MARWIGDYTAWCQRWKTFLAHKTTLDDGRVVDTPPTKPSTPASRTKTNRKCPISRLAAKHHNPAHIAIRAISSILLDRYESPIYCQRDIGCYNICSLC